MLCGSLETKSITYTKHTEVLLSLPPGDIVDINTNHWGGNLLMEFEGTKKVYFIGKSYYDNDIGIIETVA